uniref:7TM_GPCR_Srx domain-containing protein n=1 Tax=Steinernema glaseri TaxID=37863 RepID=A0A1I8A492_9BILA
MEEYHAIVGSCHAVASLLSVVFAFRLFTAIIYSSSHRKNKSLQILSSIAFLECCMMSVSFIGNVLIAADVPTSTSVENWTGSFVAITWMCLTLQRFLLAANRFVTVSGLDTFVVFESSWFHKVYNLDRTVAPGPCVIITLLPHIHRLHDLP